MQDALSDTGSVPRILVADEDPSMCAFYRESFAECDVLEAVDGRDALTKALVRPPSLVITEIDLPRIDGIALCSILRSDHLTAQVPIWVVTSEHRPRQVTTRSSRGRRCCFWQAQGSSRCR